MNLIAAADCEWGIGKNNQLLYSIPRDMQRFKKLTEGGAVIMGRKTFMSLPGTAPLRNRTNIVLTRRPDSMESAVKQYAGADERILLVCTDLPELAKVLQDVPESGERTWVIGGAETYQVLLPYCKEAYVTRIMASDKTADCFMVNLEETLGWKKIKTGTIHKGEGFRFRFDRYENAEVRPLPHTA